MDLEQQTKRALLSHVLAALAYRTQKALRGAPAGFAEFDAGSGVRTPHELICHMRSVLGYARTFIIGGQYDRPKPVDFDADIEAFHEVIEDLSHRLMNGEQLNGITEEVLLQGPFSDAMTHAGQLAMLRRLHSAPVHPENFIFARISDAHLTRDQPEPAAPDPGWTRDHK